MRLYRERRGEEKKQNGKNAIVSIRSCMDEVVSVFFVWNLFDTIFPEKCKNEFIITGL